MKSLWIFMKEKNISKAVRVSLENFGSFVYNDTSSSESHPTPRNVQICPLYALSSLSDIISKMFS